MLRDRARFNYRVRLAPDALAEGHGFWRKWIALWIDANLPVLGGGGQIDGRYRGLAKDRRQNRNSDREVTRNRGMPRRMRLLRVARRVPGAAGMRAGRMARQSNVLGVRVCVQREPEGKRHRDQNQDEPAQHRLLTCTIRHAGSARPIANPKGASPITSP